MAKRELIRSESELRSVADLLSEEAISAGAPAVSRSLRVIYDDVTFTNGEAESHVYANSNINHENIGQGIYSETDLRELRPENMQEAVVSRDLVTHRVNFLHKGFSLPSSETVRIEEMPTNIQVFDSELREFTRDHPNTGITRTFSVEQRIIANSEGGISIESIPFMGIRYSHGFAPIPTFRDIRVVCNNNDDVRRLPEMIKYLADPTLDGQVRGAKSFTEAFHNLQKVAPLRHGSLEDAGIEVTGLYDVAMITGVPIHEIFGHHFEEPVRYLEFGESGTFRMGQEITNKDLELADNPNQRVEGFRVMGFSHFDAYGRPRERREHIKDGHVVGFLGSEYVDLKSLPHYNGMQSSPFIGNAVQYLDGQFPQSRMSCTFLDGKTEDVDLEGKIVAVPYEGHTNPNDKTYNVRASECYVIQDGKPVRIIPLQVTGGIHQALANITLMEDFTYQTGMCGKPEPIYYPQPRGGSSAPVSQYSRSQLWQAQQVFPLPISERHIRILENPNNTQYCVDYKLGK